MRPQVADQVFGDGLESIQQYVDILARRGIDWGLIGPRGADRLWDRHVLNSAALMQVVPPEVRVLDVGSGAGLPGIPLAIARPDLSLVLLEPLLRRANFLTEVVDELGLGDRVEVVRGRAEEYDGSFEVVTARAVAPLEKLIGWTQKLFLPAGELLALKGATAADEVAAAAGVLRKRKLTAEVIEVAAATDLEPTYVVRVHSASVSRETR